ncbi:MAG: ABC transporter ATP-binding protein [Oscillospiraceae bacterium]|nr:ABC transporter ATP-binding protein [Oscillospiraceae bacterium]
MADNELLRAQSLQKYFYANGKKNEPVKAVDNVSLSIAKGETFGLVGESGSGKTTLGRLLLRLIEPQKGRIVYNGTDITRADMRPMRRKMQIIFQNPSASLDPAMRVKDIIAEGLRCGGRRLGKKETEEAAAELLESVGLVADDMYRYPGEFSGGQQQRIGIARARAADPEFIVCDEPVSALDVSYQSQIVNLLVDLKKERQLTYLFISHDLSVVMHISDRVGVMYMGRLVEVGNREDIVLRTAHPYTAALLSNIPIPDPKLSRARVRVPLDVDSVYNENTEGCRYFSRCPKARPECKQTVPELKEISPGHFCACLFSQN